MKRSWADAKVSMAAKRLIGHTEPYEGRILKIVSIQAWRSKDGYDRRDYIQMEIDGIPKNNLAYFLRAGQVDMFHVASETKYGVIHYQENIEEALIGQVS